MPLDCGELGLGLRAVGFMDALKGQSTSESLVDELHKEPHDGSARFVLSPAHVEIF